MITLEICRRAFMWTSFDQDKRGKQLFKDYQSGIELIDGLWFPAEIKEKILGKFERLFSSWVSAKSNCMSSAITGPARFPVEKARRANDRERATGQDVYDFNPQGYGDWLIKRGVRKEQAAGPQDRALLWESGEVKCFNNITMERVQIEFPGNPDEGIRAELKRSAFRWAPSMNAWQRKNTKNGISSAGYIKNYLDKIN